MKPRYLYLVIPVDNSESQARRLDRTERSLDQYGQEGWELVAVSDGLMYLKIDAQRLPARAESVS